MGRLSASADDRGVVLSTNVLSEALSAEALASSASSGAGAAVAPWPLDEPLTVPLTVALPFTAAVISGATGLEPATAEERAFLGRHAGLAVRATGTHLGHALEPQFPANIALATMALQRGQLFPPGDVSGFERPMEAPLRQVVVTSVGHWRGECLALVEAIE